MCENLFTIGRIVYMDMTEDDGLILKGKYKTRKKYFVIVGFTIDGKIIGSLLINTNPNEYSPEIGACQYPLKKKDYVNILDYDCWLDCSQFFEIHRARILKEGENVGELTEQDRNLILQFLVETDVHSNKTKRWYGLI